MTFIFHINIHDTLSIWKNTHGTCYILTANLNYMKKTDKNKNENVEWLTLLSSNDSAIESKKNPSKKYFLTQKVKKRFFCHTHRFWHPVDIFSHFWGNFFWFYSGIIWGYKGRTLKIFIFIFVYFFQIIEICR